MASEYETVADIVAEMMLGVKDWKGERLGVFDCFADRIEAAHQREVAELRKGISELLDALQTIYNEECTGYGTGEVYYKWRKALEGASND